MGFNNAAWLIQITISLKSKIFSLPIKHRLIKTSFNKEVQTDTLLDDSGSGDEGEDDLQKVGIKKERKEKIPTSNDFQRDEC